MPTSRPTVAIVGTGRLARALAPALAGAGYPLACVAGRRLAVARQACRGLRGTRPTTNLAAAALPARLLLLAVSDTALPEVAVELAALPGLSWRGKTVLHHAGALGLEPLRPLARRGAATGLLHPLQALGRGATLGPVGRGIRARVDGAPAARAAARRICADLGLTPLRFPRRLDAEGRAAYHAAASLASNDLLALLSIAIELLVRSGLSRRAALEALTPLAVDTLDQARRGGVRRALTGPVARGDEATLRAHLRRLRRHSAGAAEVHRLLSRRLLEVVGQKGPGLEPQTRRRLRRLLSGGRSPNSTV